MLRLRQVRMANHAPDATKPLHDQIFVYVQRFASGQSQVGFGALQYKINEYTFFTCGCDSN
jgi:hypothetical protein